MSWEESKAATSLKRDFLNAWFAEDQRFFLTGGSALGMFYLDHRRSYDLDLFTTEAVDAFLLRNQILRLATSIGATCEPLQSSPDFHRFELRRGDDREVVDLVIDRVPQLDAEKNRFGAIQVDTLREIIANKWAAVLGRTELKDLVDLYFLEKAGHDIMGHVADAGKKDAGLEPAVLSHLIASVKIESVPGFMIRSLDLDDFQSFVDRIRRDLANRAFPGE